MSARKFGFFLSASPELQLLLRQAGVLAELQRLWEKLAPQFATTCRIANVQQQTLIVHAANGAVAAKLKQSLPSLAAKLRQQGVEISGIRVEVRPTAAAAGKRAKRAALSESGLNNLRSLGQSLADSPLKKAVAAMVRRHARLNKE